MWPTVQTAWLCGPRTLWKPSYPSYGSGDGRSRCKDAGTRGPPAARRAARQRPAPLRGQPWTVRTPTASALGGTSGTASWPVRQACGEATCASSERERSYRTPDAATAAVESPEHAVTAHDQGARIASPRAVRTSPRPLPVPAARAAAQRALCGRRKPHRRRSGSRRHGGERFGRRFADGARAGRTGPASCRRCPACGHRAAVGTRARAPCRSWRRGRRGHLTRGAPTSWALRAPLCDQRAPLPRHAP